MIQMNSISRGKKLPNSARKLALSVSAGLLALLATVAPATAQAIDPTTRPATTRPAPMHRLIGEGLSEDGRVKLTVNKSTVITTTQPYKQVSIGQPEVADVNMIGPNNILVTAKKAGTTQLIIWDDQNRSQVADVVVDMDLDALQSDMNSMFPGTKIQVSSMNGSVALRGRVPNLTVAEQAANMASPYSPRVLNFLEVAGGQQVMLQVRFAEVSRRATSALGVNFSMTDGVSSFGSNIGQVNPASPTAGSTGALATPSASPSVTLFGSGEIGAVAFRAFVAALRQNNLLRILAEPNLIAMSGQDASFLAGGEFPVPVPQSGSGGGSTITVDYREFGVRLNFTPIVLGDGRIRLKLAPEVSDLDFSSPLVIQGSRIPIVNKRRVETVVELADGQTFAIAGLLDNNLTATKDVTPLLGDLPVLGALFRSVRYERRETELVVMVTPKLVEPMNPSQVPALPGESWRHPKESELFINADLGGENKVSAAATAPAGGAATPSSSKYKGSAGFTPPPRAATGGTE